MINVMLVDDEVLSLNYISGLVDWESHGFCLAAQVQNVDEALKILESQHIDLVFLDVYMPGKNGVELSREIAQRFSHVMMVAVSSYDNYDYVREILKNGAHDYLLKHQLTGESMATLLETAKGKLTAAKTSENNEPELRARVAKWLLEGGDCPFTADGSRLAITVARLPERSLDTALMQTMRTAAEQIIEYCAQPDGQQNTAVYAPPRTFVICTRFTATISEARIRSALSINNMRIRNNIRLLFKSDISFSICPLSLPRAKLPGYVKELIETGKDDSAAGHMGLTVAEKKQLLTAIEQRDLQLAIRTVGETLGAQGRAEEMDARLIAVREITEQMIATAREHGLPNRLTDESQQMLDRLEAYTAKELTEWFAARLQTLFAQINALDTRYSDNIMYANAFIKKYYNSSISLHSIAREIGVSDSYLSRSYKQETGMTVVDYLNRVRIDAAKDCIAKGCSLKETAFMCGFSSYNYFFKVFRDYEGTTPKDYYEKNHRR